MRTTLLQEEKLLLLCEPGTHVQTKYINAKTPFTVICRNGHTRSIIGSNLVQRGSGAKCKECIAPSIKTRFLTTLKELDLVQESDYINTQTKVLVSGTCGHTREVEPDSLVCRGVGKTCPTCRDLGLVDGTYHNRFLTKLLENDIQLIDEYVGTKQPILVKYSCGHTNQITASNLVQHSTGTICRICNPLTSQPEQEILAYIKSIYGGWIVEQDRLMLDGQELDILLPDKNIAIEYNGGYWHSDIHKPKLYHSDKTNKCKELGIQLIHIMQEDWLSHRDIIKSRLANLLRKSNKIYARKCKLQKILFPRNFLNDNHIQGAGTATSQNYGLFYNEELVAVMTFSKPRFTTSQDLELVRYCSKLNTTIVGGASKLFKAFINNNPNTTVVSYSDRKWSQGDIYKTLGFKHSHTSQPNYRYYSGNASLSRYQCQKHLLKDKFPQYYDPKLSESEIMYNAGYSRVFDAGSDVWIYNTALELKP